MKPPDNYEDLPEFEDRCTCNEYDWEEHECPYGVEINEDYELCVCCPFCEQNCADNI